MPRATLASRSLKNKDTGLDLFVPTYTETKGIVTSVVYYQVVLVSNHSCFKAPSHKDSDVVQYSIEKKFGDFEELRNKISEIFSGTVIPPLNKKSIIVSNLVLRERRNSLDNFVKFLACTKKLSMCLPLLEFLGVDSIRARKFDRGEYLDPSQQSSQTAEEAEGIDKTPDNPDNDNDFFGEEEDNDEDIFSDETEVKKGEAALFESGGIGVFDGQDLKRELTEEDEAEFSFIPNAIISKKITTQITEGKEIQEDNNHSDLFEFDDDLDQLMNVEISKKPMDTAGTGTVTTSSVASHDDSSGMLAKPDVARKPKPSPKPTPSAKPAIATKPKPGIKPSIPKKPGASDVNKDTGKPTKQDEDFAGNLDQDDILKYLQANTNTESADDDLDLFS